MHPTPELGLPQAARLISQPQSRTLVFGVRVPRFKMGQQYERCIFNYVKRTFRAELLCSELGGVEYFIEILIFIYHQEMSLFHDEWRKEAYYPRQAMHLRDLPQNHLKRVKEVPFEFHEYRTNNKFPCLPYERTLIQCLNNYGVLGSNQVPECLQMGEFLQECLTINKYFGLLKRWNPEHFAESQYSRDQPNLKDIGF